MTARDFHNNFDIEVDKTKDFEFPYILAEQKDYWLNKAQDQFIEDRAYPNDKRQLGFEQDQQRIDDLSWIVKTASLSPTPTATGYTLALPADYLHLVRHSCTTTGGDTCGTHIVGGIQTTHEFINQMLKDPFWTPSADEPLYYIQGKNIVYETKGNYTLSNVTITYIKVPVSIRLGTEYIIPTTDVDCELSSHVHSDILNMAVSMVLENFESPRYQTNLNELNKN